MSRILVTPRSVTAHGHVSLDRLEACGHEIVLGPKGRQPSEEELLELLPGCAGYLAGVERITAGVLSAAAPTLRVISRNGTGTDGIDLSMARTLGIDVLTASGANARGVAELTIGLLFALARGVVSGNASVKRGGWDRSPGFEVAGRTLGVLGHGNVGRQVSTLALGLGMRVMVHDPVLPPALAGSQSSASSSESSVAFATFEEILCHADILTLHCPPPPGGRPLLNSTTLASMRRGSCIINTARFDLIDGAAVLDALESGQIAGLALDVFSQEPPARSALLDHPKVICTPHIGGFTTESIDRAMDVAVGNLITALGPPA